MLTSDLQRLQRLFAYFKKHTSSVLEGCCALIELIDEDDLTNWYVLLKYEDENKKEFFVSLRIYFFEELQRMPLVFVIAPRIIATFIHHGAICSLELMSQQWSVDAEGIALLIRSLHATLNPFSHDSRVAVDELNSGRDGGNQQNRLLAAEGIGATAAPAFSLSAYTREEHELGIRHIRQSHPHLFRACTRKDSQPPQQHGSPAAKSVMNSTTSTDSISLSTSYVYHGGAGKAATMKAIIHSQEELQELFLAGGLVDAELDVGYHSSLDGSHRIGVDAPSVKCKLPTAGNPILNYTMKISPYGWEKNNEKLTTTTTIPKSGIDIASDTTQAVGECSLTARHSDVSHKWKGEDGKKFVSRQSFLTPAISADDAEQENKPHYHSKHRGKEKGSTCMGIERSKERRKVVLVLEGEAVMNTGDSNTLSNAQEGRRPEAPCTIPAGCTLRLEHLTVYGAIVVLGTLEMHDCNFIGHFSSEGEGRVEISQCRVCVDSAETRREGILVLDASTLEIRDGTTVRRREYTFTEGGESVPVCAAAPFLLQAFILISNSGTLRIHGGCHIMPYGTEKTIFAEQDASVDIADCSIMAGYSSAVSILGCHAFFSNTRFYGADCMELQVSDLNRPTGLNVELGGLVTARHCVAEYLYFGFSVIAHSVSHFFGCHAEHVVNGYTIDASSVTIENSSARSNHVGVFVLNKAKCKIMNEDDHVLSFDERCRLLLKSRENVERQRKFSFVEAHLGEEDAETSSSFSSVSSCPIVLQRSPATAVGGEEKMDHPNVGTSALADMNRKLFMSHMFSGETATAITASASMFPLSFRGGLFSLEVRDASMVAKGLLLVDAQETSIYVYDQGVLTLTDVIVWKTLASPQQPCGVKIVNSRANVQRCLVADYSFGFAAIQGTVVRFEECMAVGGTNGFTVDDAHCTLHHCGANTEHVGVFALNRSTLRMDNLNAPKCKEGWLSCVLKGHLHGVESRSSDTICIGVTVQRSLDSGFTCYNGGCLRLEKCTVDISTSGSTETNIGDISCRHFSPSGRDCSNPAFSSGAATAALDGSEGGLNRAKIGNTTKANSPHDEMPGNSLAYSSQKNCGVKAWSGSRCLAIGCEVRHVTFGYAAIGPDTELEASHCTAKHIVNGFTVDSAKCRLSRCSTNSNHVGVFVLSHGTCTVRRGSYTARMYSIENRNGIVHIEGHVKLSGFSRIGLYVYDGARLDTLTDSMLDIKVRKDHAGQQLPPELNLTGPSANPSGLFPSCFAIDKGNAVIHNAFFGGGAQCAVSCGDGANVYLHQCTAEFCNIAFNALSGSQMYLSNCCARDVRHHALIVHRGGVSRVNRQSPIPSAGGILQGRIRIEGKCFLEHVILHPTTDVDSEQFETIQPSLPLLSSSSSFSAPLLPYGSESFIEKTPLNPSLPKSNFLIYVTLNGTLVMDCCLVLLEEHHRVLEEDGGGGESVANSVIVAEGCRATVQLRNVLFQRLTAAGTGSLGSFEGSMSSHGSVLLPSNTHGSDISRKKTTWYGVVLLQGAKGDIHGFSEAALISGSASTIRGAAVDHPLEASQARTHFSPRSSVEGGDDAISLLENHNFPAEYEFLYQSFKKGRSVLSVGEIVPLRVYLTRASSLTTENVNVRKLVASGGSTIDAVCCFFAGADAVTLSGGSTFRAVESRFVSAVFGPAMRLESATVHLRKCRGYSTHKEVIVARSSTLTFVESLLFPLNLVNNDTSGASFSAGERWLGISSRNDEECEIGKGDEVLILPHRRRRDGGGGNEGAIVPKSAKQGDTSMPKTAVPTCLALENTPIERRVAVPLGIPLLSHARAEETRSDTLPQDVKCLQPHDDGIVDHAPLVLEGVQNELFRENCPTEEGPRRRHISTREAGVPLLQCNKVSCVTEEALEPAESETGSYLGRRQHFDVRLEHSYLYCCGATRIEGGVTADAFSRIEASRSTWFSGLISAARKVLARVYGT
ncbi:hypothetical protein C4B63_23g273 [Trypanosoma cruzi]|uniref:Right handed beta helix domain-containing protein n=1 Tax=Trypanosoma cruzi TaxID=5693 RepID=A0A2V2VLA3_TRYCR|nr:hypothetical protein C4B63_23g273 [Trypanosoma cruzi]